MANRPHLASISHPVAALSFRLPMANIEEVSVSFAHQKQQPAASYNRLY